MIPEEYLHVNKHTWGELYNEYDCDLSILRAAEQVKTVAEETTGHSRGFVKVVQVYFQLIITK